MLLQYAFKKKKITAKKKKNYRFHVKSDCPCLTENIYFLLFFPLTLFSSTEKYFLWEYNPCRYGKACDLWWRKEKKKKKRRKKMRENVPSTPLHCQFLSVWFDITASCQRICLLMSAAFTHRDSIFHRKASEGFPASR